MKFWPKVLTNGNGSKNMTKRAPLMSLGVLAIFFSQILNAAQQVPPELLSQVQSMSPDQREMLARQYGIELPYQDNAETEQGSLGEPAAPLIVPEAVQQRLSQYSDSQVLESQLVADDELKKFGHDFFSGEVSTFAPVDSAPAPSNYELGAGDVLNVYLYGNESADLTLTVNRDGILLFPRLGPISVVGLTFEEAKELIAARVSSQLVGTKAVISISKLRAINVFLAGEVAVPGNYSVSGLSTAMQALFTSGGITELGSLRNIEVKRQGETLRILDLYDVLLRGDTTGDARLVSGDTVFVPLSQSEVKVTGAVKRPAVYEVRAGESIGDVIAMAGGLSSRGYAKEIAVERRGLDSLSQLQIDLSATSEKEIELSDGDKIEVREINNEILNRVLVRGALVRPGGYAWFKGMRVSDVIDNVDDDLRAEADLSAALLVRRTGIGLEISTQTVDLKAAILQPGSQADILLNSKDELLVFALPYVNESYQNQFLEEEDTDLLDSIRTKRGMQLPADEALKTEEGKEESAADTSYEDRRVLIDEVVAKLEAQAQTPETTLVVEVNGDVRLPGKYPLPEDKKLSSLFGLAGGFETSAYLRQVEVNRTTFDDRGRAINRTYTVDLNEDNFESSFELKPLDQIRVKRIPFWSYGDTVEITGAVEFPGKYSIAPGDSLSMILDRTGGLADFAFPEGAVLIKASARKREREQIERLVATLQKNNISQRQTREAEDSLNAGVSEDDFNLIEDLLDSAVTGRVIIDLPAIIEGDSAGDIRLENGDSLHIPYMTDTVMVVGEVREPGTFRYSESRSIDDYVALAAGATVRADNKEIYIVRANGSVRRYANNRSLLKFTTSDRAVIEAGDTVVVPLNEEYQPVLSRYKEVSTVIFQSIASLYPLFRL